MIRQRYYRFSSVGTSNVRGLVFLVTPNRPSTVNIATAFFISRPNRHSQVRSIGMDIHGSIDMAEDIGVGPPWRRYV